MAQLSLPATVLSGGEGSSLSSLEWLILAGRALFNIVKLSTEEVGRCPRRGEEMEEKREKEGAAPARVTGQQADSNRHWSSMFRFHHPLMITCGLWLPRQMYQAHTQSNLHVGSSLYHCSPSSPYSLTPLPATPNNLSTHPKLRAPGLRKGSHPSPHLWGVGEKVSVSSLSVSCESPERNCPKSTTSSVGRGATDLRPQERQNRMAQENTAWGYCQNCSCLGQHSF